MLKYNNWSCKHEKRSLFSTNTRSLTFPTYRLASGQFFRSYFRLPFYASENRRTSGLGQDGEKIQRYRKQRKWVKVFLKHSRQAYSNWAVTCTKYGADFSKSRTTHVISPSSSSYLACSVPDVQKKTILWSLLRFFSKKDETMSLRVASWFSLR